MVTDEYRYKILKLLEANPGISQRQLAKNLNISLGKTNYCLKALIEKGLLKVKNFQNSHNKSAYLYILTPNGIEEKANAATRFLNAKLTEYESIKAEIQKIKDEPELSKRAIKK